MSDLRRISLIFGGAVVGAALSSLLVVGCGGDDTVSPTGDAAPDQTTADSTTDQFVSPDVTPDQVIPTDAADASDASDASDSSTPPDAPYDGSALFAWETQVAAAFCQKLASCCFGADASAFTLASCEEQYSTVGYAGSSEGISGYGATGQLTFNPTSAANCLLDINALNCTTNQISANQQTTILHDCFGAVTGTLATGAVCQDAIQCQPTDYCNLPEDGGTSGTCAPLVTNGNLCGNFGQQTNISEHATLAETACSYRASGTSGLTCEFANFTTGDPIDAGAWQCVPQQVQGAGCNVDLDCQTQLCDIPNTYTCLGTEQFAPASLCQYFTADGG